jgi:hypothetical protein
MNTSFLTHLVAINADLKLSRILANCIISRLWFQILTNMTKGESRTLTQYIIPANVQDLIWLVRED